MRQAAPHAADYIQAADSIRSSFPSGHDVVERKMMGGLVFMVGGNMCLAVSGRGGLLVRVGPDVPGARSEGAPGASP